MKATVQEVKLAYRAFRRIGDESRLHQKAAWEVSRIIRQLKDIMIDAEETEKTLILGAGGVFTGNVAELRPPVRDKETDDEWAKAVREFNAAAEAVGREIAKNNKQEVELTVRPLKISLFQDDPKTPAEKKRVFAPNDFADAGPFLVDDEESKPDSAAE